MRSLVVALAVLARTTAAPPAFVHPGVLVGAADLAGIRARLAAGTEPTLTAFRNAVASPGGKASYVPHGPPSNGTVSCGYYDQPNIGCSDEDEDVDAAYTQALLFAISGNVANAVKAREIISLYAAGLRRYTNNTNGTCCGNEALQAAWDGAKFARAAELLRHTPGSGWTEAETTVFTRFMYDVHVPLLYNGTPANGNWLASFVEALFGAAVFNDDAELFNHAVAMWRARAPSYFYISSDGAGPPANPQPNCEPQPLCEWYNQTVFNASVTGVSQETCRDLGHMQMGLAGFVNGGATAALQGVDLLALEAPRLFAGSEFAARLLLKEAMPDALICSGVPAKLALAPTFEIAHALFARLGLDDVQTRAQLTENVRPKTNTSQIGSVFVWETLSHGLPLP